MHRLPGRLEVKLGKFWLLHSTRQCRGQGTGRSAILPRRPEQASVGRLHQPGDPAAEGLRILARPLGGIPGGGEPHLAVDRAARPQPPRRIP
jgi:hypothetical protein